jgi:CRISPR-associated protein Csm1
MNTPDIREQTLWLAALLHDIGKFYERAGGDSALPSDQAKAAYSHEPFSALFVDRYCKSWPCPVHALREMVLRHHQPEQDDEYIVSIADRLSANERDEKNDQETGGRGKKKTRLRSVLTRLKGCETELYYRLRPLDFKQETLTPVSPTEDAPETYQQLWDGFAEEISLIQPGDATTLLGLLKKYTWCIPSDASRDTIPDISLYDHLKTTAAIALCLHRSGLTGTELRALDAALKGVYFNRTLTPQESSLLNREICLLVKGDISGTQDFIYLLTSKGAARGLRGRSVYLQWLTEAVAAWILRELRVPATNLIFAGGGHFYLLLPFQETQARFENLRQQIAERLWKAHTGDLSLNLGSTPVTVKDFLEQKTADESQPNSFAQKWVAVSQDTNQHKEHRWRERGSAAMIQELFTPRERGVTEEQVCQVCRNEWIQGGDLEDGDIRKCRRCAAFEDLGTQLREPRHLIWFEVPDRPLSDRAATWKEVLGSFGLVPCILSVEEQIQDPPPDTTSATVFTLDDTDFLSDTARALRWGQVPFRYDFRLLANATPYKGNSIAEFDDLAEAAEGAQWLGVLRMDMDDLGKLFREGLGERATLSRMSTLSESLRLFFEAHVPRICRGYNRSSEGKTDTLYLLYAGGDDLFVVGAWSTLPLLARDIHQAFQAYVGGRHVTLSGGIALEHRRYPLYQLADDAHEALDGKAKAFQRGDGKAKEALCFLQTAMGWEHFEEVADWHERLFALLNEVKLPAAILTRLSGIYALYDQNARQQRKLQWQNTLTKEEVETRIFYDKWQWHLVYQLGRYAQRYKDHADLIHQLQEAIVRERDGLIRYLHVLARWTALRIRGG